MRFSGSIAPFKGQLHFYSPDILITWITDAALGVFNAGTAINTTIAAVSSQIQPPTYSVVSGALPSGVSLSSSGKLTGTPANLATSATFTVRASIGNSFADRIFTMSVLADVITWTTAAGSLGSLLTGQTTTTTLTATSSFGRTISYAITSGSLPVGLTLSGRTITGSPTTTGISAFTITASDGLTSAARSFSIAVTNPTLASLSNYVSAYTKTVGTMGASSTLNSTGKFSVAFAIRSTQYFTLYPNDPDSNITLTFSVPVTMKSIDPQGSWLNSYGTLNTEALVNGSWVLVSQRNGNAQWSQLRSGDMSDTWRVRVIGPWQFISTNGVLVTYS